MKHMMAADKALNMQQEENPTPENLHDDSSGPMHLSSFSVIRSLSHWPPGAMALAPPPPAAAAAASVQPPRPQLLAQAVWVPLPAAVEPPPPPCTAPGTCRKMPAEVPAAGWSPKRPGTDRAIRLAAWPLRKSSVLLGRCWNSWLAAAASAASAPSNSHPGCRPCIKGHSRPHLSTPCTALS
jgi:hypothetical protein